MRRHLASGVVDTNCLGSRSSSRPSGEIGSICRKAPIGSSTSDGYWKEHVREAEGGHKLEVAFDAVGGKAIDDPAEIDDDGGTIINFGSLESNVAANIYSLAPNNLALKSVLILSWFRLPEDQKRKGVELALNLATNHSELFEVAHEYMNMSLTAFKEPFSMFLVRGK